MLDVLRETLNIHCLCNWFFAPQPDFVRPARRANKRTRETNGAAVRDAISRQSKWAAKSESVLNKLLPFKNFHVKWILLVIHTRLLLPHQIALLSFSTASESKERLVRGRPGRRFGDSIHKIPFFAFFRNLLIRKTTRTESLTIICLSGTTDDWI